MTKTTWNQYKVAVEREFPAGTECAQTHGGGVEITVPCKNGHMVTERFKLHMPGPQAKKVFVNKGWRLWGTKSVCPEHNRKDDKTMEKVIPQPEERVEAQPAASPTPKLALPVASVEAREAKRMAVLLLDEKFDTAKGAYRDGYSDLKVAREIGLAEAAVADLRDNLFGPIREPAEITELREKTALLETKIGEFERERTAAHDASGALLRGLNEEVVTMKRRLAILCQKNGW